MIKTYKEILMDYIAFDRVDSLLSITIDKIDKDCVSDFIRQFKGIDISIEIPDGISGTINQITERLCDSYEHFLTTNRLVVDILLEITEGREFTGKIDRSLLEIKLITDLVICGIYLREHIEEMSTDVKMMYNVIYGREVLRNLKA